jgi:hypothetical protein
MTCWPNWPPKSSSRREHNDEARRHARDRPARDRPARDRRARDRPARDPLHETLRTALATIRELRAANQRLEAGLAGGTEPIAIVAASYRLPGGADSPERFWEVLTGSHDVVRPLPVHRWAHLDFSAFGAAGAGEGWAGSIDDVAGFDAEFFGNRTARRS